MALSYIYKEQDCHLIISEDPSRTPRDWKVPQRLGQALKGILEGLTFGLIIGTSGAILASSLDDVYTICI